MLRGPVRSTPGMKLEAVAGLTIVNHHGAISAMDIAGAWDLTATYENIEAHRMATGGKASNKHADILVEKAGGTVIRDYAAGVKQKDGYAEVATAGGATVTAGKGSGSRRVDGSLISRLPRHRRQ